MIAHFEVEPIGSISHSAAQSIAFSIWFGSMLYPDTWPHVQQMGPLGVLQIQLLQHSLDWTRF